MYLHHPSNQKPCRVLLIHIAYTFGGAERTTLNTLRALKASNEFHTILLAPEAMRSYWGEEVDEYHDISPLGLGGWFSSPQRLRHDAMTLAAVLQTIKPQVIIGMMHYIAVVAERATDYIHLDSAIIGSFRGPIFEHLAAYEHSRFRRFWIPYVLRKSAHNMFAITVPGEGTYTELLKHRIGKKNSLHIIANGIDIKNCQSAAKLPLSLPQGIEQGKFVMGLGRLSAEKRFAHLLDAYAASDIPWPLVMVGDGAEKAALESQAKALGITHKVFFAGASSSPERWLARAGIFIHTCQYEGFGYTLLEAAALGIPTIATDCPFGPREVLAEAGVLVQRDCVQTLAQAMQKLYHNNPLRRQLSLALQKRATLFPLHASQQQHCALIQAAAKYHSLQKKVDL